MTREETCEKKKVWKSKHLAKIAAGLLEPLLGHPMRTYCCSVCGFYHHTSKEGHES